MKRITSIISLCLITIMLLSLLSGCSASKKFVGTWQELDAEGNPGSTTLVLANDGTGSITEDGLSGSVNWSVDDDKLFVTISMCGMTVTEEYTYEFSGKTMTLTSTDGTVTVYRKSN